MRPLRIANATRVLAETQDEYYALAILDQEVDGHPCMTSAWEPTKKELAVLNAGGSVRLTILGTVHPPVIMTTHDAPSLKGG